MSPLHLAAKGGHLEVVRCLLLSGADPDLPNKVRGADTAHISHTPYSPVCKTHHTSRPNFALIFWSQGPIN